MKHPYLISIVALVLFTAAGCDKQSSDTAKKIAELEQKNNAAAERQRELEQQLEDRKLAAERDAIERERMRIEDDRAALEREKGEAAAADDEAIREREEALANREGKLEQFQSALGEKEDDLRDRAQQLGDRDRELAGREALEFEQTEQLEPVADYGMFYDSLSSYGSWFETSAYGYVWQPVVVRDSNWRPYSRGRWVCSDRGWTWVSEEPFGWATYHYGRWALLRGRGWVWVPGSQWAPCWVSWRESGSHIGWAPLPPETLAYRGHAWDSTVDVQFGIGARWFNFVEIRHFGSPVFRHCLPVSRNETVFGQCANITYIHTRNRQVISGGPRYKDLSDRIGRPLPFYRLEVDQHPRQSRDPLAMRPQFKGGRLVVSAPNVDAAWNDGLKPGRIKGRMESVAVERDGGLNHEIADRYRRNREEGRQQAEQTITELGGRETFDRRRNERLQENRRQAENRPRGPQSADSRGNRPPRDASGTSGTPGDRESGRAGRPANPELPGTQVPDTVVRQPVEDRGRPGVQAGRMKPQGNDRPRVALPEETRQRPEQVQEQEQPTQRQADGPRVAPSDDSKPQETAGKRQQNETRVERQRQAEPAGQAQKEDMNRKQEEARQAQQQEKQSDAEQTRAARQEAMNRAQEEQAQQREAEQSRAAQQEAVNRRQEEAQQQRQEQQEQQRAMQQQQQQQQQRQEQARQQQEAQQQRQEQARQQQEEAQQQRQQQEQAQQQRQEQARQQQEEAQQQRQEQARQQQEQAQQQRQEQARQQQEQAQQQRQAKDQKDEEEKSKKNR